MSGGKWSWASMALEDTVFAKNLPASVSSRVCGHGESWILLLFLLLLCWREGYLCYERVLC
jgi:hypothetical protein